MTYRFTDSEKFRDVWYRKLKVKHKCLWEFLLAECSNAGIIEIDLDSFSFHIGEKITSDDLLVFKDKVIYLKEDLIFIPRFIKFQQPSGLNENNNAHKNIIKTLEKYGISENLTVKEKFSPSLGASEELASSPSNSNSNSSSKSNTSNRTKVDKREYGEFKNVKLTDIEFNKLFEFWGGHISTGIEKLSSYIASSGKTYKNHYAVLGKTNWVYKQVVGENNNNKFGNGEKPL